MKTCTKCKIKQPHTSFYPSKQTKDGREGWCRSCAREAALARYHRKTGDPGHRTRERESRLKHKFGITQAEYDAMFRKQKGKCAICKRAPHDMRAGKLLPLSVDHNHKTGKVRGLLCKRCNTAIGLLDDDLALAERAVAYLGGFQ